MMTTNKLKGTFYIHEVSPEYLVIEDECATIARIGRSTGTVDWLQVKVGEGNKRDLPAQEPHMMNIAGYKFEMLPPSVAENGYAAFRLNPNDLACTIENGQPVIRACYHDVNEEFEIRSEALCGVNITTQRYQWQISTSVIVLKPFSSPYIEFNNIYPSNCGRGMLFARQKRYDCTVVQDADGVYWSFPHQHRFSSNECFPKLTFGTTGFACFLGPKSPDEYLAIDVLHSDAPLSWGVCNLLYDHHCGVLIGDRQLLPGESLSYRCLVYTLDETQADEIASKKQNIPVPEEIETARRFPRFDVGINTFTESIRISSPDESFCFYPQTPMRVWDTAERCGDSNSLRLENEGDNELDWPASSLAALPDGCLVKFSAMVKTEFDRGGDAFIEVTVGHWSVQLNREVIITTRRSFPLIGTHDWSRVEIDDLRLPENWYDCSLHIRLAMHGKGAGCGSRMYSWILRNEELQYEHYLPYQRKIIVNFANLHL